MEADYEPFEVVCVIRGHKLIDSESYERRYWTPENIPLPPGYYVVHWPAEVRCRRFDRHALYHGPFARKRDAQTALDALAEGQDPKLSVAVECSWHPRHHIEIGRTISHQTNNVGITVKGAADRLRGLLNRQLNAALCRFHNGRHLNPGPGTKLDAAERFGELNPGFFAQENSSRD